MAAKKTDLDVELGRLYRRPPGEFTAARNDLVKQLRKLGGKQDAEQVRALAKPTPSAWAVNLLFEREGERMEALLAAGKRARAGQRQAVSGRGAEPLRESLGEVRRLIEELRRRGAAILAESGRSVSRTVIERIGTDLQALALSPAAAGEVDRRWLDRDLDPPGFEVLAGLQLAGAPVVDIASRRPREEREEKKTEEKREPVRQPSPPPKPRIVHPPKQTARDSEREKKERERQEAVERAHREREEERIRRRIEVAEEKVERARNEADSLREETEEAEKAASETRRRAEAAELAAQKAREKAERAAERLARAEDELKAAKAGR